MAYQITDDEGKIIIDVPCEAKLEAQEWALGWARSRASEDHYYLKCDGANSAHLFHAVGGQWYLMNA